MLPNEEMFDLHPVGVRYRCELCGKGEMKVDTTHPVEIIMTNPPQRGLVNHICTKCKGTMQLPREYPYVSWLTTKEYEQYKKDQEVENVEQAQFIYLSNSCQPWRKTEQTDDGDVIVQIRPKMQVIHNHQKGNQMKVALQDKKKEYEIKNSQQLRDIYRMHRTMEEWDIYEAVYNYCINHLKQL